MTQHPRRASALTFALFMVLVAPASALDVQVNTGTGQLILASPDLTTEQSRVTVTSTDSGYTVTETGAAGGVLTPGTDCAVVGFVATCSRFVGSTAQVFASLGGEDDHLTVEGLIIGELVGGSGNDRLIGGDADDIRIEGGDGSDTLNGMGGDDATILGGPAIDLISGGAGNDSLEGDDGDDILDGNEGSDLLNGGAGADDLTDDGSSGNDTVTYGFKTEGVTVTLNGLADDGNATDASAGRSDNVKGGIDSINATPHADTLIGSSGPDRIFGSPGDDDITGGAGADTLVGNDGNDTLRARDGEADTRIDCDADSGSSQGSADAAFIDGGSVDPVPSHCEAVDTGVDPGPGGEDPPPEATGAPTNTFPPAIRGRLTTGDRLVCDPGTWTSGSTFAYSWTRIAPGGARSAVSSKIDTVSAARDAGAEFECSVTASKGGKATTILAPLVKLAAPVVAPTFKKVTLTFPDFVSPTKRCGRKNFCEAEDVRSYLVKKKLNLRWKAVEGEGLRSVPASARKHILPGEVFKTSPKAGKKLVSSASDPAAVTVRYYVPNADRDCPIEENVNVRGGEDYTLADLVVGMALRDALAALRENGCKAFDYERRTGPNDRMERTLTRSQRSRAFW